MLSFPRTTPRIIASAVSTSIVAYAAIVFYRRHSWRWRRKPTTCLDAEERLRAGHVQPKVLATLPSEVSGRPWYQQIVVSDVSAPFACPHDEKVIGLHLGSVENPPESLVVLRRQGDSWIAVPDALLKRYARYSLLAFTWLPKFQPGSRALLIGLGAGSLVHYWTGCMAGGAHLEVDAIELDGAVLRAARSHLDFSGCEARGKVHAHVADGAQFLRDAEDEAYDLVFCDLDMGVLLPEEPAAAEGAGGVAAAAGGRKGRKPARADPPRDMYRSLSERGVLVINEYSEETPAVRLQRVLRCVRELRRFFPEVHVLRPNGQVPCSRPSAHLLLVGSGPCQSVSD